MDSTLTNAAAVAALFALVGLPGCSAPPVTRPPSGALVGGPLASPPPTVRAPQAMPQVSEPAVRHAAHDEADYPPADAAVAAESGGNSTTVGELVAIALASNPRLGRLSQEAAAAWDRVPQVRSLPDPMVAGSGFIEPMLMADGETRGTLMVSQMIPWLGRLDAEGQQAACEAWVLQQELRAEQLRIAAEVKAAWYRLYLLSQQVRINEANQELLGSLIEVATSRVSVGRATQGDVLLATVELSRLAEDLLALRQQQASSTAVLNQLLNRPADAPLPAPVELPVEFLPLSLDELRLRAENSQPAIAAARLRAQATAWGIRVARLRRVPDLTVRYERMFMDMAPEHAGSPDPWQLGGGINVPLWSRKYRALESEATRQHFAAQAGVEEVIREYDALLLDALEQARAADRTLRLYETTILPQTRQTLDADQQAYAQGQVEFDRVVADVRNVLAAEISYHRAVSERATALARLERAVGVDGPSVPEPGQPPPVPLSPQADQGDAEEARLDRPPDPIVDRP
ncbi:MAG TPA: TolC family protein [Planctomycetaceae bacterium]|nr:TolC family protein [Planctomycetaceae bacterium]